MLTTERLKALMADLESDRVVRTTSTKNTDKFAEAVCAFANDFPNHRQPGYLLLGIADSGKPSGLMVKDDLLLDLAALRSNVNLEPLPAMTVQKYTDRIETQNPGGLYGMASPENFPRQTDYRNPVISEAMATLGFVNAFGRGVIRAQEALRKNGNPPAEFTFETSHVLAIIRKKR